MDLSPARRSMAKMALLCAAGALVFGVSGVLELSVLAGPLTRAVGIALLLAAAGGVLLALAGLLVLRRQRDIELGRADLYLRLNRARSESAVLAGRVARSGGLRHALARSLYGQSLLVGDTVRVRAAGDPAMRVDADGCTDGLPWMDEQRRFAGQRARVYRVVDKVYDFGRSRQMRRLPDAVLLVGLRCDGRAHGGCEAGCYLLWKGAWLQRVTGVADAAGGIGTQESAQIAAATASHATSQCASQDAAREAAPAAAPQARGTPAGASPTPADPVYRCQLTQLTGASWPVQRLDHALPLRSWVVGNIGAAAAAVALATRAFNTVQQLRGGACFPAMPPRAAAAGTAAREAAPPEVGAWVTIRPLAQIAATLDANSKMRGLWFDRDMAKFGGQSFRVRGHVSRIIDVKSGRMIAMKRPCIVLDGVDYTGEFQHGGEQHEFLYWRSEWLASQPVVQGASASAGDAAAAPFALR
jgi:hypothetical protein